MTEVALSIIAALIPFLVDWMQGRKETKPYEDKQELRKAVASGDTAYIARELDRLREEARRRGLTGK